MGPLTGSDNLMLSDQVSPVLEWLCCPDCRSELTVSGTVATCVACGRTAHCLATNLLSFVPDEEPIARTILGTSAISPCSSTANLRNAALTDVRYRKD